jgi:hypothetical protein
LASTPHRLGPVGVSGIRMMALRRYLFATLCAATILCATGATLAAELAKAENGTKVPGSSPRVPATKLACLKKNSLRYTGKVKPRGTCEIGGLVEASYSSFHGAPERLGRGGSFARFSIEGPISAAGQREGIAWLDWGASSNHGLGTNPRSGHEMDVTVYRRVECADGSSWYSRADVTDTETAVAFYLRLPVCGSSVQRGTLGTG